MCRGSGLSSPRSTRLTMSVSTSLARHVRPTFSPSRTTRPFEEFDFCAPALLHILTHRRALSGGSALALPEALLVAGAHCSFVAFARARNRLGWKVIDLLKLVAERLPDADRFAADAGGEMPDPIVVQHLAAAYAGAGGDPIGHRVGDQLRPTLAPQVTGHFGAVRTSDQAADLLHPLSDAAVHVAGAKYGVRPPALAGAAVDQAGLREVDRDAARDAAERLAPADDASDRLFVHAILQRDHVAVGCQILPDQHRCPCRVVRLHAHEGDVDRLLLGELLHVRHVQGAHGHAEFRYVHGMRHAQAVLSHLLDVGGPRIDERHVLAGLYHMGADIAAHRTRSDNGYLPAHTFPPGILGKTNASATRYGLMPASWITFAHFGMSALIRALNSSGGTAEGSSPIAAMFSLRSSDATARAISRYKRSMISCGVPAGAQTHCGASCTWPGTPASSIVGTSGRIAIRFVLVTASARSRPSLICADADGSVPNGTGGWPA